MYDLLIVTKRRVEKVVDDRFIIKGALGRGTIRREVWQDENGKVIKFNLAFIYPLLFGADNGRAVGYDTAHGHTHRHWFGQVESVFLSFEEIVERFTTEVEELLRRKKP